MKIPAVDVEGLRAAAMLQRRSPLWVWMLKNYDTFAAIAAEAGRPNWKQVANWFHEAGLKDTRGKPPSADACRQTWYRVRRQELARRKSQGKTPTVTTRPRSAVVVPVESDDDEFVLTDIKGNRVE